MPKFFLHIYDREVPILDAEGEDFEDLAAARIEALHIIYELVVTGAWAINSHYGRFIAIENAQGDRVDTVALWEAAVQMSGPTEGHR